MLLVTRHRNRITFVDEMAGSGRPQGPQAVITQRLERARRRSLTAATSGACLQRCSHGVHWRRSSGRERPAHTTLAKFSLPVGLRPRATRPRPPDSPFCRSRIRPLRSPLAQRSTDLRPARVTANMADPDRNEVLVTADVLPLGALASRVVCPTAGAIATFIGTTRDHFEGKSVLRLEVCVPTPCRLSRVRGLTEECGHALHPRAV